MKRTIIGFLPFLCIFFLITFINKARPAQYLHEQSISVQNGLLTLPKHSEKDVFTLKGLWHFTPNQFYCFMNSAQPQYAPLPGTLYDTSLQSPYGYASYGLRIVGLDPNRIYALQTSHILSSCTIIINGFDRAGQGQPGISLGTEIPGKTSSLATFRPHRDGSADVIINISNFHNRYGGTEQAIRLGATQTLNSAFVFDLLFYNLACILLFAFSVFFIILHLNYKKIPYIVWFACTALTLSIRITVFYPHICAYFFPSVPWKLYFILRYATIPLSVLFFTVFIKKIFHIYYKILYHGIIGICIIAVTFTLLVSTQIVSHYLSIQQLLIFIGIVYNTIIIIRALLQKKPYSLWIIIMLCSLIISAVHDILVSQWILSGKFLLHEGAMIAIIIIVIMSISEYVSTIHQIERLAEEQKVIQKALRRFVPNQLLYFLQKTNITEINTGDASELRMTVLSIDIRSFTSISEQLSPDQVFMLLNRYFAIVVPIIRKHDGVIMKFLGDGFTALFSGSPDEAVICGIEIQKRLQKENIHLEGMPPIRVGIGIDTGKILLGIIGNDDRLDSMVISNTCYTADELQAATKIYASTLIISESIFRILEKPEQYHIRRIQELSDEAATGAILYEVYDGDEITVMEKKEKTQSYLEQAFKKIREHNYTDAKNAITKSLEIFPDDRLAVYYQNIINRIGV